MGVSAPTEFRYFCSLFSDAGPTYVLELFDSTGRLYSNQITLPAIIRLELTNTGAIYKLNGSTVATSTLVPLSGMYAAIARGESFYRINSAYSTYNSALIENLRVYSLP